MWYLLLYPNDFRRLYLGMLYMSFIDYETAEQYARINGIKAIITDDLSPFLI